jgi:1,2-diacylglycerol 3-alpha-glucosyltransferase/glucuronosyltransferase
MATASGRGLKITLATDAWHPQINGVVRSLSTTVEHLRRRGHEVTVIEPSLFWTVPCPTYPEIRLAVKSGRRVAQMLDELKPDAIHVATEAPIGLAARGWCLKRGRPFTTSFHTRFPDYVSVRSGIPADWIWPIMRRFHEPAERTFVVTLTLAAEIEARGIGRAHLWPLGVDLELFNPHAAPHPQMKDLPRPILLNVGRVAVEKNIEAFLSLQVAGTKVVVGGGPALDRLKARYPETVFLGPKHGAELVSTYTAADIFVFPSRTDTFGLVNVEALACGLPVAAYPVPGPVDILGHDGRGIHGGSEPIGALDKDLGIAIRHALLANRASAAAEALHYGWESCTDRFVAGLSGSGGGQLRQAA